MAIKTRVLLLAIAAFAIVFSCYVGYQSGYSHGERNGYNEGQIEAWSYYPQMSFDSLSLNSTKGMITLRGVIIVGEDTILDIISGNIDSLMKWR